MDEHGKHERRRWAWLRSPDDRASVAPPRGADDDAFDAFTRAMATSQSRRGALRALGRGAAGAIAFSLVGPGPALAAPKGGKAGASVSGDEPPDSASPVDCLAATNLCEDFISASAGCPNGHRCVQRSGKKLKKLKYRGLIFVICTSDEGCDGKICEKSDWNAAFPPSAFGHPGKLTPSGPVVDGKLVLKPGEGLCRCRLPGDSCADDRRVCRYPGTTYECIDGKVATPPCKKRGETCFVASECCGVSSCVGRTCVEKVDTSNINPTGPRPQKGRSYWDTMP